MPAGGGLPMVAIGNGRLFFGSPTPATRRLDFSFIDLIIRVEIQDFQVGQSSQWREVSNVSTE
jgi:hypothetical protein